jgi:nitronate monooxygenase
MPMIETALTRLLEIEHPILLAPMYGTANGHLAAAVSHAGGLGMFGAGIQAHDTIPQYRAEAGNARVGIGFIQWRLEQEPDALDLALDAHPVAIMLSFGDPTAFASRIKAAGTKLICQVQSLAGARVAAEAGADVIVAQGRDAGGHSSTIRGTMALVPAVVDAVAPIPVVAAGGLADGRGLAAALALGASGILMGTRFAATQESLYTGAQKAALAAAGGDQTGQTRVFDIVREAAWPTIYPGRALKNEFFEQWHGREEALTANLAEAKAAFLGSDPDDVTQRVVFAGESVDMVRDNPSAREIVERTMAEAVAALRHGAALLRD